MMVGEPGERCQANFPSGEGLSGLAEKVRSGVNVTNRGPADTAPQACEYEPAMKRMYLKRIFPVRTNSRSIADKTSR